MDIGKTVSQKAMVVLKNKFEEVVEETKQIIIAQYDEQLTGFKIDRRSKIDYTEYRDEFVSRLNDFQFIEDNGNGITLNIPDMKTFDFSDGLEIVRIVMEGLGGVYIEVDEKEYLYIVGRKPKIMEALDDRVSPKNRVFLVPYIGKAKRAEKELNRRFVRFPFSNKSSTDILEVGESFVNANLDKCMCDVTDTTIMKVVKRYK